MNRRWLLIRGAAALPLPVTCLVGRSQVLENNNRRVGVAVGKEQWIEEALSTRGNISGRLEVSRFVEPIYFLLRSTSWIPNQQQKAAGLSTVHVPRGFVTDLASIPQIFYSLLRPDGEYAHAAIVHDFLYWVQTTSRSQADEIFQDAMRYLEVEPAKVTTLFKAVQAFGASSWEKNKRLKISGERRIMRELPDAPNVRWKDWRQKNVFL